jgi:hypothetical protein
MWYLIQVSSRPFSTPQVAHISAVDGDGEPKHEARCGFPGGFDYRSTHPLSYVVCAACVSGQASN